VWCSLEQAARGHHTAWALSNAMESVDLHYRKTGPISTAQCDELLSAVVRAQLGAIEHLPKSYSRKQIDRGMQALAGQIMLWAETCDESARRAPHVLADLRDYARMFRNDLHNISLREEIDRRAWERREQHIQPLRK
jgi:predicted nucleic acid-binding protein